MFDLKEKVAIVTGGASGIGLATVEAFLKKGAKVILSDVNEKAGKKAIENLKSLGEVAFVYADVSKENDIENLVKKTVEKFGRLDVLFNNAGIGVMAPTHTLSYEDYHKVVAINQDSIFFGAKYAVPEMKKIGGGVIINTASILGYVGQAQTFAYNASKGAVNLMTKSLAIEYAADNIRVNSVNPGYVISGMVNKESLGEFYDSLVAKHPIGRLGNAHEIAHAVVFLTENTFMTGANVYVDGGFTAQ